MSLANSLLFCSITSNQVFVSVKERNFCPLIETGFIMLQLLENFLYSIKGQTLSLSILSDWIMFKFSMH